ncbi:DUF5990 family protein [Streptomyces sp. 150FB]|uniref:DUF5990 family protein n=1 Tax=Streptomyces sp. 150FB TaxID=1576605 RepID=UPI001F492036|nr:DUF5990 family protein [Streptomyces sp. 150FB]
MDDDGLMLIRIEVSDLPGRAIGPGPTFGGVTNVHVGVQRKDHPDEVLDPRPGDAGSAAWTLECAASAGAEGIEISGRYVQNRFGGRFVYLSWGTVDEVGLFTMFRRAKLMLGAVEPKVLEAATRTGCLTAKLGLTDPQGHPLCGAVRPPLVAWSATRR